MSNLGNKKIMAENIRHYMEIKGKSRSEVCKDLGFKYTTFTDWVNGNSYPRIDKIEMLAHYFGITKADLVEKRKPSAYITLYDVRCETEEECNLVLAYRKLNADGRRRITEYTEDIVACGHYQKEPTSKEN